MDLKNSFEVDADKVVTWNVLNDVELVAPCLPGAQLEEIDGDKVKGSVKVKVGPVTAQYKGTAVFIERDEPAGTVVIKAEGRDSRGAGNASALITAKLQEVADSKTRVEVVTDLAITGKVAQFGRGVMGDVSNKLMAQFAENLKEVVDAKAAGTTAVDGDDGSETELGSAGASNAGPRLIKSSEVEAVDLLDAAGVPLLQRLLPVAGVVGALLILRRMLRGRSG